MSLPDSHADKSPYRHDRSTSIAINVVFKVFIHNCLTNLDATSKS